MNTLRYVTVVSLGSVLVLGGCQSSDTEMVYDLGVAESAVEYVGSGERADSAMAVAPMEPSVITTGYLTMSSDQPSETADAITTIVVDSGGRVSSRSDYTPVDFGQPSAYLEVRIPSAGLDPTVEAITALGVVQEISVNTFDVSMQKVDLDARIAVLEAAIARLRALLDTAASTADVISVETALTERQAELDSLQSQRDFLGDQTVFATLSISVITPADATPADPDGFLDGLERGWLSILAFFAGVVVWAGVLVPWIGLGALAIAAIWLIRRIVRASRNPKRPTT